MKQHIAIATNIIKACITRGVLLCRHPGRTLVFVNAVSALRRVAAILKLLGMPVSCLHAQQQQRQRLKVRGYCAVLSGAM
jgi:superfamily II DNA/RNA helicase